MTLPAPTDTMIPADGGAVHVRVDGRADAPTVLLIHGFAGSLHWFDDLTRLLSAEYRVIRADLRGHGRTGGDTGLDPESQSRALASVLDSLDARGVLAVGHSYGADVALALARRSDRVRAAAIIGQAPDYSYAKLPRGGVIMTLPVLGALLHRLSPPAAVRLGLRTGFAPGFPIDNAFDDPDRPIRDHRAMSPAMYRAVLTDRQTRLAADPLDAQVRALGKPCLVIHGDRDQMYDPARTVARYTAAGAEVEIVPGAGHSPNIERPHDIARILAAGLELGSESSIQ
ncbi:alpha/beta hydrolase [Nocardia sp. NBC_01377]|uniref:alpha/beta fold hydrolase n=1 Tax=Nocardia sp. NBC_01377 TaxID=2903595 RepID=UPI0032448447